MNQEIINFFKCDRSYEGAKKLYHKYGNMQSLKKQINNLAENPMIRGTLFDQLRLLAGLSLQEYNVIMSNPIRLFVLPEVKAEVPPTGKPEEETNNKDTGIPEPVRKTIRLRQEFPFLSDPACPIELKILVSDKLTCYENYKAAHELLFEAENEEQLLNACSDVVDNYLENQQIWDELNHYKETGELLKKHPIFATSENISNLKDKSLKELINRQKTLEKAISLKKKQLEDNDKPELTEQRQISLGEKEYELTEVLKEIDRRDK